MPSQSFSSFEAFFDANRHASLRAMVLGPERGKWGLTNLTVDKLSVQFGEAGTNAVVEGSPQPGGVSIFMLTQGLSAMSGNGRRFDDHTLLVAQPGDDFCLAADSWRRWCSLYVPNEELAANLNSQNVVASVRGVCQLTPHRMERFRSIIRQLDEAVQQAPDVFKSIAAQKAARQKLVPEIRTVLALPREVESTFGRHVVPRSQIIHMSMDFVDQHGGAVPVRGAARYCRRCFRANIARRVSAVLRRSASAIFESENTSPGPESPQDC